MDRIYARWIGSIFTVIGVIGFFVQDLFGILHLHTAHNVFHLLIGITGIAASVLPGWALRYTQISGIAYLLLGILGFFVPELFGLMHLALSDNIVHLIFGALGTYIGFVLNTNQLVIQKKTA